MSTDGIPGSRLKLTLWLWRVTYMKVIFTICKKCSGETKGEEENRRSRGVGGKEERRGEKLRQRGREREGRSASARRNGGKRRERGSGREGEVEMWKGQGGKERGRLKEQ